MKKIFTEDGLDVLSRKVRWLLQNVGYGVHYEPMASFLKDKGLKELPSGNLAFDDALIDEFAAFQTERLKRREPVVPPVESSAVFHTGFGNMVPKFYDYSTRSSQTARMEHVIKMAQFAHQEERVSRVALPFSVIDAPLATAPIEAFLTMVRLTDKYYSAIDPLTPDLIPYLLELSDVFLGPNQQNTFIDHCNCINPILRLEERTAEVMFKRTQCGIDSLMTSMPTSGGNAPITLDGTVVLGAAEVLGGVIMSYLLNPDVDHVGYISSSTMDFRTVRTTQSSPETVQIDCGVVQLMEYAFGGNTRIGGRTYISSVHPGMQAVFEKMFKAAAYAEYTGEVAFAGGGVLDNGSLFSPEQFLVDMDIQESFQRLREIPVREDNVEEVIQEVAAAGGGDFLSNDHTLDNYPGILWEPALFSCGGALSEKEMLDKAHVRFVEKVDSYSGYDFEEEKVKAGEEILARAKQALL